MTHSLFLAFWLSLIVVVGGIFRFKKANFANRMMMYGLKGSLITALRIFYNLFYLGSVIALVSLLLVLTCTGECYHLWFLQRFALSVEFIIFSGLLLCLLYLIFHFACLGYLKTFWKTLSAPYFGGLLGIFIGLFLLASSLAIAQTGNIDLLYRHPLLNVFVAPYSTFAFMHFGYAADFYTAFIASLLYALVAAFFLLPIPQKIIEHYIVLLIIVIVEFVARFENDLYIITLVVTIPFIIATLVTAPFFRIARRRALLWAFAGCTFPVVISFFVLGINTVPEKEVCALTFLQGARDNCYLHLAMSENSSDFCEAISRKESPPTDLLSQKRCYEIIFAENSTIERCRLLSNFDAKESCFSAIGRRPLNEKQCDEIEPDFAVAKSYCYFNLLDRGDRSLCEKIDPQIKDPGETTFIRERCLSLAEFQAKRKSGNGR